MVLAYDLSSIKCPGCDRNNENIEILGKHVIYIEEDISLFYDFICPCCQKVFTKQTSLSLVEI